jgi:hypothetical protein
MGRRFEVCNGDADGLCAAVQWRLQQRACATLVTGLKREIALVEHVQASPGDEVDVFDLAMDRNRVAVLRLLDAGVTVRYFDHHAVAVMPSHPLLDANVDCSSDVCTSLLVDRRIGGSFRAWALVGAYGDNLAPIADRLAGESGIGARDRARLRRLGEAINYNAYGDDESDVHIAPARLHAILVRYADPRDFLGHETVADEIDALRQSDLDRALAWPAYAQDGHGSVYVLPDAAWSRRVLGSLANQLANAEPNRAHAVLKPERTGGYSVSVRAPLALPSGADALCRRFGGGGRARAAGIDGLASDHLERFVAAFGSAHWSEPARRAADA